MQARFLQLCLVLALAVIAGCAPAPVGQSGEAERSTTGGDLSPQRSTNADTSSTRTSAAALPSILKGKDGVDMLLIPAGKFLMGSPDQHYDQRPVHQRETDAFYMDKFEVTNAQYKGFVDDTGRAVPYLDADYARKYNWQDGTYPSGKGDHPVVLVNWEDARAYCEWAGKRLPSEPEWEKAARGTKGQIFPWGDEFVFDRMNTIEAGPEETMPVGSFPDGASPYGLMDMAGNVWEWTADWFDRYPGNDDVSDKYGTIYRVVRGSSWGNVIKYARGSNRNWIEPWYKNTLMGFRCAASPPND